MVKFKTHTQKKTVVINIKFSFKIPASVAANMARQGPEIYLKKIQRCHSNCSHWLSIRPSCNSTTAHSISQYERQLGST